MPRFMFEASYTLEGIRGVQLEGGTQRRDAVARLAESVGGSVEAFYFALGDPDAYVICELPDNVSATSVALAVNASGAVRVKTVALLTPSDVDAAAAAKGADYRPPGG